MEAGDAFGVDLRPVATEGTAPAGSADDPARGESDDHDGSVGRHHRRADRRRRARPGGRVRARQAADRPWRRRRRLHLAPRGRSRPYNSSDGVGAALDAGPRRRWASAGGTACARSRSRSKTIEGGRTDEEAQVRVDARRWWRSPRSSLAACSDVDEGGGTRRAAAPTRHDGRGAVRERHDHARGQPVGRRRGERRGGAGRDAERDGLHVELAGDQRVRAVPRDGRRRRRRDARGVALRSPEGPQGLHREGRRRGRRRRARHPRQHRLVHAVLRRRGEPGSRDVGGLQGQRRCVRDGGDR